MSQPSSPSLDRFVDADDLHPAENKRKMSAGIPLDDADRRRTFEALGVDRLRPGTCVGVKVPPFLGGAEEPENREVDSLEVGRLEVLRRPLPAPVSATPEPDGSLLPDLPVKVEVKTFKLAELVLGEALAGQPARLTAEGRAKLGAPAEGLDLDVAVRRLDAEGLLIDIPHDTDLALTGLTGLTAVQLDITERLEEAMAPYLAIVVGLAIVLLLLVFRSILVPLVAGLGFLLSVGGAFGLTVLVWQEGLWNLVPAPGPLISFMPIFLIGVTFGLAMDYQVFLVTRMREHYLKSGDLEESTIEGFGQGARVVTAALSVPTSGVAPARRRCSSTSSASAAPRGRRPGSTSHEPTLLSWMCTLGSSATPSRSLAASPDTTASPPTPQWYGRPTVCTTWSPARIGRMRSVTSTRASMAARGLTMVAHPPFSSPRSSASSGETSQNISGCSSAR